MNFELLTNVGVCGFRIIENALLTKDSEPIQVPRSWRERLFSWPWRPFAKTKTIIPQIPSEEIYQTAGDILIMHPQTARRLKEMISEQAEVKP